MRYSILGAGNFIHVFAVVEPVLIAALHQDEFLGVDKRLAEIDRIGNDHHMREQIAMPDVMLDDCAQVAARRAAAPIEFFFDVGCGDGQNVAVPLSGGEAHERVRRILRRMRPPVHPDRPPLLIGSEELPERNDLLRRRIFFGPYPELHRTTKNVRKAVRLALVFEKRDTPDVETLGVPARRIIHRNAREVALHIAGNAVGLVFVVPPRPFSFKSHLSE